MNKQYRIKGEKKKFTYVHTNQIIKHGMLSFKVKQSITSVCSRLLKVICIDVYSYKAKINLDGNWKAAFGRQTHHYQTPSQHQQCFTVLLMCVIPAETSTNYQSGKQQ